MLSRNLREAPVTSRYCGPFHESRGAFQFSIRQFLVVILVGGVALAFWQFLFISAIEFFWIWMVVIGAGALLLGTRAPSRWRFDATASIAPRGVFVAWVVFTCFLLWMRYRWLAMYWDDYWPRPSPYPDGLLSQFHDWIDAKYPAPGGVLKLHGEVYSVLLGLNAACFLALFASSLQFGFLFGAGLFPTGRWFVGFGKYLWQEWNA